MKNMCSLLRATKSKSDSSMIAVEFRGIHIYVMGCAYLYRVHVVLQYATDVKNLKINSLRLRFWGKNKNATSLC